MACEICNGTGLVCVQQGTFIHLGIDLPPYISRPCECQEAARIAARIRRAAIPAIYDAATLESFKPLPHAAHALAMARKLIEEFSPAGIGRGLLLTGSVGTGKTHLAIGTLRAAIAQKGALGRFVDVREFMDRLRSSYSAGATESQAELLKPIMASDLVLVDDLGSLRLSDWVFETMELLLGGLYNRGTAVIVTTNFANLGPGAGARARQDTLGDRIGARIWSRLQEMCVCAEMNGPDWRGGKQ